MSHRSAETGWKELKAGPFMDGIGPILRTRTVDGNTLYGFQTDTSHCNALGAVHGGVLASLLDQAMAVEAWNAANRQPTVTLQMDTRFITAARAGELLEAGTTLRHGTRSILFMDAEIHADDRLVATATAVMKIVTQKEKT